MNTIPYIIKLEDIKSVEQELFNINCDKVGVEIMKAKGLFKVVKIPKVKTKVANVIKQTFLAKGAEVAVARGTIDLSIEYTDLLVFATMKQYKVALAQLKIQPWGAKKIAEQIELVIQDYKATTVRDYHWSDKSLVIDNKKTLIMGILNLTPDSFSDGGKFNNADKALQHLNQMIADGADIIDIGAESTRPYNGGKKITAKQELERLLPILEYILPKCPVPISIDTYKAEVAEAALKLGAHIINDVLGLQYDHKMAEVIANYNVPVVVMHNKENNFYENDVIEEMLAFLQQSIDIGLKAGIKQENIIIDPGIGFGKDTKQNLYLMAKLERLQALGCPILLGTSRKRFIGETLGVEVDERVEGTIATAVLGKTKGVQILRVHDVKAVTRAIKMTDIIMESELYEK